MRNLVPAKICSFTYSRSWTQPLAFFLFFSNSRFLLLCKISEEINEQIPRETGYMHTYVQMDGHKHEFIRTHLPGVHKGYFSRKTLRSSTLSRRLVVHLNKTLGWGIQGKSYNSNVSLTWLDIQIMIIFMITERNDNNSWFGYSAVVLYFPC